MTSTPPAWKWRDECEVPVTMAGLSIHSHKPPESDALRERNGGGVEPEASCFTTRKLEPDPTGEDVWPLERAVSTNAIDTCCALGCDCTAQLTNAQSNAVETHTADPPQCPVCLHEMENDEGVLCDHCGEPTGPGSFAVVNGPGGVFVYHLPCYDEVYWGGQEAEDVEFAPLPAHMRATFDACLAICVAKNADYASSSDPLANFRACEQFGVKLTKGIMVRLSDKFARIGNLLDRGAKVREEAIADTIDDAVNYLAILKYALETETSAVTGKCRGLGASPATASRDEDTALCGNDGV